MDNKRVENKLTTIKESMDDFLEDFSLFKKEEWFNEVYLMRQRIDNQLKEINVEVNGF